MLFEGYELQFHKSSSDGFPLDGSTGRLKVLSSIDVNYRTGVDIPVFDPEIGDYVSDEFEDTASYAVGNLYAAYSFADSRRFADSFMGGAHVWLGIEDLWDEDVPMIDLWGQGYDPAMSYIRGRYFYGGVRFEF